MNLRLMVVLSFLLGSGLMVGCKKTEPAPPAPTTTNASPPAPGPATTGMPPQKLSVQPGADIDSILADLSKELRRWVRRNQRVPASFEEFVSSAQLQPPPPPSGKKYVINRGQMSVVLASR